MLEQQPKEPVATVLILFSFTSTALLLLLNMKRGPIEAKPGSINSIGVLQLTSMGAKFGSQGIHTD